MGERTASEGRWQKSPGHVKSPVSLSISRDNKFNAKCPSLSFFLDNCTIWLIFPFVDEQYNLKLQKYLISSKRLINIVGFL